MSRTTRKWVVSPPNPDKPWQQMSRPSGALMCGTKTEAPSWWNRLFDTIPRRRNDKAMCGAIIQGLVDPDDIGWGVIERRPHCYYR